MAAIAGPDGELLSPAPSRRKRGRISLWVVYGLGILSVLALWGRSIYRDDFAFYQSTMNWQTTAPTEDGFVGWCGLWLVTGNVKSVPQLDAVIRAWSDDGLQISAAILPGGSYELHVPQRSTAQQIYVAVFIDQKQRSEPVSLNFGWRTFCGYDIDFARSL